MIDKNKQVEELAKTIYSSLRSDAMSRALASILVDEGYCKSTEIAKEIFEGMDKIVHYPNSSSAIFYLLNKHTYAKFKRKYTEGEK